MNPWQRVHYMLISFVTDEEDRLLSLSLAGCMERPPVMKK